jgi:hypothetical protein
LAAVAEDAGLAALSAALIEINPVGFIELIPYNQVKVAVAIQVAQGDRLGLGEAQGLAAVDEDGTVGVGRGRSVKRKE